MSASVLDAEVERRWAAWLVERNRRGLRLGLFIMITLYPAFGVIDWLLAPAEAVPWLWGTRVVVTSLTLGLFAFLRSRAFERHFETVGAGYTWLGAAGVSVMTTYIGGLESPYYAGVSLMLLAAGLLLVWRPAVVVITHSVVLTTFVAMNVAAEAIGRPATALSNLAFLSTTALVAAVGQILTYRTQREQLVQRMQLEATTGKLERAHADLKQLDAFKSRFFANMTHELRSPLAMIVTPLELLLDGEMGPLSEPQRHSFASMYRSSLKLLKLISDLLDLSRLEESRLRLTAAEHDLVGYLRGLVEQSEVLARRRDIALSFTSATERATIRCDLDRLERVFVNLLSNAIKFTPSGGRVEVSLARTATGVDVAVEDDGPGFAPEHAERLFERFYQADMEGTRRHGGAGIGLSLARELVHLHGGTISASSDGRRGARFVVSLPAAHAFSPDQLAPARDDGRGDSEADWMVQLERRDEFRLLDIDEATERRIVERDPDEEARPHTVLVVEDSPQVLQIVHMTLRRDFKVLTAADGARALERVAREQPSLIVTDLMMPGMDGLELTRRLRADPRTQHIPVLMLTARGAVEDRVHGLDTGVSAYLTKPFSPRELVSAARQLVRAEERTAELVLDRRMESVEIVAAGLAHEINNPLNYVKNALARVRLDGERVLSLAAGASGRALDAEERGELERASARMREMLDVAASGIARIGGTVELMGRYGQKGFRREVRPIDVWEAIRTVVGIVRPATGRSVEIDLALCDDGTLECVPEEFQQVLTNLVQNAIEAAPETGGKVRVAGGVEGDRLVLSVADNGPGIPADVQARLFTPFFTTKGPGRGMGLGLTIARRVVQSLGGTLLVTSAPGAGAEFVVRVPRRQPRRELLPSTAARG